MIKASANMVINGFSDYGLCYETDDKIYVFRSEIAYKLCLDFDNRDLLYNITDRNGECRVTTKQAIKDSLGITRAIEEVEINKPIEYVTEIDEIILDKLGFFMLDSYGDYSGTKGSFLKWFEYELYHIKPFRDYLKSVSEYVDNKAYRDYLQKLSNIEVGYNVPDTTEFVQDFTNRTFQEILEQGYKGNRLDLLIKSKYNVCIKYPDGMMILGYFEDKTYKEYTKYEGSDKQFAITVKGILSYIAGKEVNEVCKITDL
jgi:hypothetical protein